MMSRDDGRSLALTGEAGDNGRRLGRLARVLMANLSPAGARRDRHRAQCRSGATLAAKRRARERERLPTTTAAVAAAAALAFHAPDDMAHSS